MSDADEELKLPSDTLQLLQQFNQEKAERQKQFEALKDRSEDRFENHNESLSMDLFDEDWNVSQFWYNETTASTLAKQLLHGTDSSSAIAVVSAPSVYVQLRKLLADQEETSRPQLCLLEYDRRFEVVGPDFVFYDYQQPLRLPEGLRGRFDRIICDPPFLSEDCQTKTALTVRFLSRQWAPSSTTGGLRFVSCTGERMESLITKLYGSLRIATTTFEPEHTKGLSNEFRCYANFECEDWHWRKLPS